MGVAVMNSVNQKPSIFEIVKYEFVCKRNRQFPNLHLFKMPMVPVTYEMFCF